MTHQLVLLETTAKQQFIFESNKLRDNLGASQMVYESVAKPLATWLGTPLERLNDAIVEQAPIEDQTDDDAFEVVIAPSGKAIVVTRTRELAERLVFDVTSSVLRDQPGLRTVGVIEEFDFDTPTAINGASARAHRRLDEMAARTAFVRSLRLPIVEDCAVSGLPAANVARRDPSAADDGGARSASSLAKAEARARGIERLRRLDATLASSPGIFDGEDIGWIAVIHADGNGLGKVFMDFGATLAKAGRNGDSRTWIDTIRQVSIDVEKVTERAFVSAIEKVASRQHDGSSTGAIVPIVLGGDDLTALCDGRDAWEFTRRYLTEFARLAACSEAAPTLSRLFRDVGETLTASAGVAFVKHHFPFSDAYRLADELASSAKSIKPAAAVDFHVLYDSTFESLGSVRSRLVGHDEVALWGGPYAIDDERIERLDQIVERIAHKAVAASQIAQLRDELRRSAEAARKRAKRLFPDLEIGVEGNPQQHLLLDALALADVAPPQKDVNGEDEGSEAEERKAEDNEVEEVSL